MGCRGYEIDRDVAEGRERGDTSTLVDASVVETIRASK